MNLAHQFSVPPLDRAALVVAGTAMTYEQLGKRVDNWRSVLVARGFRVGDRIVLLSGNDEAFVIGYLACLTAGLVTVPLNPQSPPAELLRQIDLVEPNAVIIGNAGRGVWAKIAESGKLASAPPHAMTPMPAFVVESEMLNVDSLPGGFFPGLDELLDPDGVVSFEPVVDVPDDHPALFLFTSGTAGEPKPAILTHKNLERSLKSSVATEKNFFGQPQVFLGVIPLFHVFGVNLIVNLAFYCGATLVLENYTNPLRLGQLVEQNRVTLLAGPPTMWAALVAEESLTRVELASVKVAVSGAARLPPPIAVRVADQLGIKINEGYGLTETAAVLTSSVATDAPIGSVGKLMPGVRVRLVDGVGDDVLVGDVGEIWVKGPMVSPGYWSGTASDGVGKIGPKMTEVADGSIDSMTSGGWLRTGDLAVVDEDGYLAIMARIIDLIIVSGFNVHPAEVQTALVKHWSVREAEIRGERDDVTGERIVAYVVAADGQIPEEVMLRAHCATELARYKIPARIEVVPELPVR